MFLRICGAAALLLVIPFSAHARLNCEDIKAAFGDQLADVTCFASADLTTKNPATTPANNSIAGLPPFAFTPQTDRAVISPATPTPVTKMVPGLQIQARIASDPKGEARFLLRLPNDWNGRLVVAGASGTRSEFNGDFAWSDYVVQKGYAYASQNKGVLNLQFSTAADPLACRLNPASSLFVRFYDNEEGQPFTRWTQFMVKAAQLAREGAKAGYGQPPRYIYAVGTSNGGYQVRRAIETAPDLMAAGYPPDIVAGATSLWTTNSNSFWEVTACQWQKRLDPAYNTYGSGVANYNYISRLSVSEVSAALAAFATSGDIRRPLITVAGTMDALLPIDHHARAYARRVAAAAKPQRNNDRGEDDARTAYRLYEIQNGNHLETNQLLFSQLELIQPHAQKSFDLLVEQVENGRKLPPSQCVPRGGAIAEAPAQPGHCASLFVP